MRTPFIALGGVIALALSGCASSSGTMRTDVEAYLARAESWAPVEAETARTVKRILETQFVDEAEVRHQIADSRPRVLAHLDQVRAYVPRVSPIARIHERYTETIKRLPADPFDFSAIETALAAGDEVLHRPGWSHLVLHSVDIDLSQFALALRKEQSIRNTVTVVIVKDRQRRRVHDPHGTITNADPARMIDAGELGEFIRLAIIVAVDATNDSSTVWCSAE